MKVILEYNLPDDAFLFSCAEQAVQNRMLLESIKTTLEAHKITMLPDEVIQEIKAQMRGFK